jgi:glutaminyl-peptide cyclotransferase
LAPCRLLPVTRFARALSGLVLLASLAFDGSAAPVVYPRVLDTHPHDADAFTQGLVLAAGVLYESTGRYGRSSARRVDLHSGRVLKVLSLSPRLFAEGLTVARGRLYQLTWHAGIAFVRDPENLTELGRLRYEGEGWGLAWDGQSLVMSDGSDVLRFLDPDSFAVTRRLLVHDEGKSVPLLNELEVVDGLVYANIWRTTRIARIDPNDGRVLDWIELAELVPPATNDATPDVANGIAYDAATGHLLVTGKLWPRLYEVQVPAPTR